ncbi:hypothetical protein SAMN05192551_10372 [Tindallia magadiensis]|uniref:Uncharacterized protein n=1 Tax=Tindallia magadiensis TaxID=69895 RepID=A0A1I3CY85_9FIRM|nr:hypothetical protein [Tindallia magadiensis]SFH79462.1 hypothetical protein SAMN05192551_10372 [Tindallia magadiensis]
MKINLENPNPALISIIENPEQIITLDANFLIAPDRRPITKRGIRFEQFTEIWLDPIFSTFPKLAIHEAVYDELVGISPQNYVEAKRDNDPPEIIIHTDSSLNEVEKVLRDAIETRIASHTKYEPLLDNKDDRGEVKSLSYIAVKGLLYFAANDHNAIQLIEKSEEWSTGLDNVQAIKMYELIYYLYKNDLADKTAMKMIYKYQYYLTDREKSTNPGWGDFSFSMDKLYESYFK